MFFGRNSDAKDEATRTKLEKELEWLKEATHRIRDLLREVVLVEAGHGRFVPRISMTHTRAWQCLEPSWLRERLEYVYTDFYYHRNESLWAHEARKKLPALVGATDMLCCGEDLGMVPHWFVIDNTFFLNIFVIFF